MSTKPDDPPDAQTWERPVLYLILMLLFGLGVFAYLNPPSAENKTGFALIFALVGFAGGLLFFLIDPFGRQQFHFPRVVNLTGAAGAAAGLMILASKLLPEPPCGECVVNFAYLADCVAGQIADHLDDEVVTRLNYGSVEAWRASNHHEGHDWVIRRLDDQYFPPLKKEMSKARLFKALKLSQCPGLPVGSLTDFQ